MDKNDKLLCSNCHKRLAVVFVTKIENGQKTSNGLCIKCAKEMGMPIENLLGDMMDKFGLSEDQLEGVEDDIADMVSGNLPSDGDDNSDGGAPAVDLPLIFGENQNPSQEKNSNEPNVPIQKPNINNQKQQAKAHNDNSNKYKYLGTYCKNLTQAAKNGKLDNIVGRERELTRLIQILCRRQKNNPCLIGEPGVGKTAIAEALAIKTANGDVPYKLKGKEIWLVDMTAIVAGTQFRGQFESRMLGLVNDVKQAGNAILVIDEVHNIVGTGSAEGSQNAANILKPALSRGEIQVIGATTLTEYRKYIEKDSALERRFQPITVNEPSVDEATEMLAGIKHYYEEFHKICIPKEIVRRAVILSERYITDRYLPDKAIDLLDEAASELSLNSSALNESYEVRDKLLKLKEERESLEANMPTHEQEQQLAYEKIATIRAEELKLSARLDELVGECEKVTLNTEDLAKVVEVWTGIPASSITANEFERIDNLEIQLKERIIGQDPAVTAVVRAIKRNRAGISYKRKPVSFIFAGPTGIGKTELVKTLASCLFHSPETLIRLDMSEFMEKHSVSRIIGSPPGYVGYDDAGQLTEKIRRRPYSVVLFDEIEKAHPDVLNVLLQILDDGRVTDAQGKTVNFENTIIVMTTNAGSDKTGVFAGFGDGELSLEAAKTEKALSEFLRPEFINRVDEVIIFRSLDRDDFAKIAQIMLGDLKKALAEKDINLTWSDDVEKFIADNSYSLKYGARNMRRYIQREIEDKIANVIIADYEKTYSQIRISINNGGITLNCL